MSYVRIHVLRPFDSIRSIVFRWFLEARRAIVVPLVLIAVTLLALAKVDAAEPASQRSVSVEGAPAVDQQALEKAVLAEDWGAAVAEIGKVQPNTPAAYRFIVGHACLALNRNDDSAALFAFSSGAAGDVEAWLAWTKTFVRAHVNQPIAHYLYGDALARHREFSAAAAEFEAGLALKPPHVLLLNAKGVLLALDNKPAEARKAFNMAVAASDSNFADALANIGASWIQNKEGAKGAERNFTEAIEAAKAAHGSFAVAKHGRACARLLLRSKEAHADICEMYAGAPLVDAIMNENMVQYVRLMGALDDKTETALAMLQKPGTTLDRSFSMDKARAIDQFRVDISALTGLHDDPRISPTMKFLAAGMLSHQADEDLRHVNVYGPSAIHDAISKMSLADATTVVRFAQNGSTNGRFSSGFADNLDRMGNTALKADVTGKSVGLATLTGLVSPLIRANTSDVHEVALREINKIAQQPGGSAFAQAASRQNNTLAFKPASPSDLSKPATDWKLTSPTSVNKIGGVEFSFEHVLIEDGKWPFRPLYGLLYGCN